MKVSYDAVTDTLTVIFRDGPVAESDEGKPGVILDYDDHGSPLDRGSRRVGSSASSGIQVASSGTAAWQPK